MTSEEFMSLVYIPNMELYFLVLFVVLLLYIFLFRKRILSIIDPTLFAVLNLAFAGAVPVFLYFAKACPDKHFGYFCISQFVLISIFLLFTRKITFHGTVMQNGIHDLDKNRFFFNICLGIYIFSTVYSWVINGIPIFNEDRFAINVDNSSGIMGMLGRLSAASHLFSILFVYYLFFHGRKIYASLLMIMLVGMSMMSGSKGFIFSFVQAYFFYSVFYVGKIPHVSKKYLPVIILAPLCVILLAGYANDGLNSIMYFGYRLLANGDTYWNAYPYSVIDMLSVSSPILNMTSIFWGPFRHIFGIDVDRHLFDTVGALLFELNYRTYPDGGAPNSQLTIVSYVYYKWYGLIMVGMLSFVGSLLYRYAYKTANQNIYICCKRALIFNMALSVFGDVFLFFNSIFNFLLFVVLYKCVCILYPLFYSKKS